jgi:hypothetical protein
MRSPGGFRSADPEWRAALLGMAAAPTLVLFALVVGIVEGELLPGACQGLGCVFSGLVIVMAAVSVGVWFVVWLGIRSLRRRWPQVGWRLWAVRLLAVVSWAPWSGWASSPSSEAIKRSGCVDSSAHAPGPHAPPKQAAGWRFVRMRGGLVDTERPLLRWEQAIQGMRCDAPLPAERSSWQAPWSWPRAKQLMRATTGDRTPPSTVRRTPRPRSTVGGRGRGRGGRGT